MVTGKKKLTPKRQRYAMSKVKPKSYEDKYPEEISMGAKSDGKPIKTLPSFHVNSREIPEIADWKQGDEYTVRVRMAGRDEKKQERDGKKSVEVTGRFEIVSADMVSLSTHALTSSSVGQDAA